MKLIKLNKRNGEVKYAIVNDCDYEWINQWKWHHKINVSGNEYAARIMITSNKKRIHLYMHRVINKTPINMQTDHEDQNGLNNQHYNLRTCTPSQNRANKIDCKNKTSKYRGVSWNKNMRCWLAQIQCKYKKTNLGYFVNEVEAAKTYDYNALKLFGKFAVINFENKEKML